MDMIMEVLDASINPAPPFPEDEQFTAEYVNSIRAERDNLSRKLESTEIVTLLDTPTPEVVRDYMITQIEDLTGKLEKAENHRNAFQRQLNEIQMKVDAVKGYIADIYSTNGEIDDDIKEIAGYLDIELTKSVTGTATFQISFTAEVPLDFDADDFEISFSAECESYEAEGFDWNEDDTNIQCEDEF